MYSTITTSLANMKYIVVDIGMYSFYKRKKNCQDHVTCPGLELRGKITTKNKNKNTYTIVNVGQNDKKAKEKRGVGEL